MHDFYSIVVLASLTALGGTVAVLFVTGVWRHLTRQLTRGGLAAFLVCAGIATVEAQKRLYVDITKETGDPVPREISERLNCDHTFKTIQEAFEYLNGKVFEDVDIFIAPGVYPPVVVPQIEMGYSPYPIQLTPYFDVTAIDGAGSVIIDGGGISNALVNSGQVAMPRDWHGLVFSNAICGATGGSFHRCIATHCKVGFDQSDLDQCAAICNTGVGVKDCSVSLSLVAENHGRSDEDAKYECTGALNCSIAGSIVWGNTKDGKSANWAGNAPWWSSGGNSCTSPLLDEGDGNICADPMFVDPVHGDFRLQMGSPCINRLGKPFIWEYEEDWVTSWPTDLAGNPRVQRESVDMGPYEYQPTNEHQTITAPVPVEFAWIDEKCPEVLAACGGDYDRAVLMKSANPVDISLPEPLRTYYGIWESYVADLDPTDSNQTFRATIEMVDGEPHVTGNPESPNRTYTVLGKESLTDEKWQENLPGAKFFKVRVGLK